MSRPRVDRRACAGGVAAALLCAGACAAAAAPPPETPVDLLTLATRTGSSAVGGFLVGSVSWLDRAQLVPEFAGGVPVAAQPGTANARFDKVGLVLTRRFAPWLSASAAIEIESHQDRHAHGFDPVFGCPGATPCAESFGAEPAETEAVLDKFNVTGLFPVGNGLALSLGRFDAPFGLERHDEVLLLTATTSDLFRYGRPNFLTGVRSAYVFGPAADLDVYVANGWEAETTHDDFNDDNAGKTLAARLGMTPIDDATLLNVGIGAVYGPEQPGVESAKRWLVDLDATWSPSRAALVALEVLHGAEDGVSMRELGTPFPRPAVTGARVEWQAVSLLSHVDIAETWGVTLRYGWFDDRDGARTGVAQRLQSVTIVPVVHLSRRIPELAPTGQTYPRTRHPIDWIDLKLEYRYAFSDQPVFSGAEPNVPIVTADQAGQQLQLQLAVHF